MKRFLLLTLTAVIFLSVLCGCGKPDRTKYDDGPAIDNGTYGIDDNNIPAEGDPYGRDEIGVDFAIEMLRRHYGYYDAELKKYTDYIYIGDEMYNEKLCYKFDIKVCDTVDGEYEPYGTVYYAKDGSEIKFTYLKAEK